MSVRRRGGSVRLSAGDIGVEGHVGAPCSMVSALVVGASGRALGRPTIWKSPADLWYPEAEAFIALASACLARGRVADARDLAYADARGEAALRLIETLAGSLMLGHAYADALPLLDVLVARGWDRVELDATETVACSSSAMAACGKKKVSPS